MHFGRESRRRGETVPCRKEQPSRLYAANTVAVIGCIVCMLFFCVAIGGDVPDTNYPSEKSYAAVGAFLRDHTAIADVLGVNDYFPQESISVGAFSTRGEEAYRAFIEESEKKWTFSEYLRDAWRALLGLT